VNYHGGDKTLPTWATAAGNLNRTVNCDDASALAAAQNLVPAASDNCTTVLTPVKTAGAFVAGSCPQAGTYTNTWTVSDDCGNAVAAVYTQVITVQDITKPTWTTVAGNLNRTVNCDDAAALTAAQNLAPVASDNCDMTLVPVKTAGAFVAGSCPQAGTYTNTWTVSDDCGNAVAAVYTQVITVQDITKPTWTTVAGNLDRTVNCDDAAALTAAQNLAPVASDNCDLTLVPVKTPGAFVPSTTCPQAGTYTNTWTVSDDCGNAVAAVYTQVITVQDITKPTWTTVAGNLDRTVNCDDAAALTAAQNLVPVASDNCDQTLVPVKTPGAFVPSTTCPQAGTYTNTWTVSDDCGNAVLAVYTQVITVQDITKPTWTTAAGDLNRTVNCDDAAALSAAQGLVPVASDNCDQTLTPVKTAGAFVAGSCPQAGTYTNTWTVSDDCGNAVLAVYTQVITVQDITKPTWTTLPGANATIICGTTPSFTPPVASDNCDPTPAITFSDVTVPPAATIPYTVTRTWYATDDCLNVSDPVSQSITVKYAKISGVMMYNNAAQTPMNNVRLTLTPTVGPKFSITATTTGYYEFTDLCTGTYTINITNNNKVVGGVNSTDAAAANAWGALGGLIQYVKFLAGDVSNELYINATDATLIQRYFVFAEPFDRAPWSYWKKDVMILNTNASKYNDFNVNISGGDIADYDLYAMCTGDFNGSFTPSGAKSASQTLGLVYNETKRAGAGSEIDLPVRLVNASTVGAVSLILNFPSDKMEVTGVSMKEQDGKLAWTVKGNELRIGWNSLEPMSLEANQELLVIHARTASTFGHGDAIRLELAADPLNELADGYVEVIPDAVLGMNLIEFSTNGFVDPAIGASMTLESAPNPFANYTMLSYTLPAEGQVTLAINDMLGRTVTTLVKEAENSGRHAIRLDASTLQPGVYFATLTLHNSSGELVRTIKIVRNR
jgi:hypothetical protein